jgi:hypothetical protein
MDIDVFAPYTIHEAEFALYLADRNGNVASNAPVFLGGKLEELEPELDFQKNRVDRHGEPFGRIYHSDEEHRFNVKNLWVMDRATKAMPRSPSQPELRDGDSLERQGNKYLGGSDLLRGDGRRPAVARSG